MAKMFDRVEIESNDDGSFSIEVIPVSKEEKDGMVSNYDRRKSAIADSLESAIGKIKTLIGSTDKGNDSAKEMNDFFSGKISGDGAED
jgi:hypothetical protein